MGLFNFDIVTFFQTPLDKYGIEKQPRKRDVIKHSDDGARSTRNQVFNGKQYIRTDEQDGGRVDWQTVDTRTQRPTGERVAHLTGWDKGFLDDKFGPGKWNEPLAVVLKTHWHGGDSAAVTETKHRDGGGALEFGYSQRNVKDYFWAFNRAVEKEVEEQTETAGAT